jgi:phosphoribosyl 1,2-cyclic phosphodiesterase
MSIELCVLASGSAGNSTALRTPAGVILIDAGLGPRTTAKRLTGTGLTIRDVSAICLTHLDRDHFSPTWLGTILNRGIRVCCHRTVVQEAIERLGHEAVEPLVCGFDDTFEPLPGLTARAVSLAHDREGSHGFVFEGFGCRIGYATDLGRVPATIYEQFRELDVVCVEANYDPQMQLTSARPWFLKNRIMGGAGHLSNEQAYEMIRKILDRAERGSARLPSHIVLLHRSRECNCPNVMRKLFQRDARIAARLTLADQYQPSGWLRVRPSEPLVGEQLALAWD